MIYIVYVAFWTGDSHTRMAARCATKADADTLVAALIAKGEKAWTAGPFAGTL